MLRFLVYTTIFLTFLLINLGGYVHNTGSSLACPDWPLCYGQIMPKMEGSILIEHSHRMLASLVGFLTILITFFIRKTKQSPSLVRFGYFSLALVIFQGVLGGLTVIYKLPSYISTAHLGTSMIYFASLIYIAFKLRVSTGKESFTSTAKMLSLSALGLTYLQMLLGALMRHLGLGGACGVGYENSIMCFDMIEFIPAWFPVSAQAQIHVFHRYLAVIVSVIVGISCFYNFKQTRKAKYFLPILMVLFQVVLGVMTVGSNLGEIVTTLHLAGATVLFGLLWSSHLSVQSTVEKTSNIGSVFSEYFSLTKPRLAGLVIFTAGIGLYLAPGEISVATSLISIIATSLTVAGACVINCYIERDIDKLMERTADRALPAGRMNPIHALTFGIVLNVFSLIALALYVNYLTAILGLIASITYIFIYTPLKTRTPLAVFAGAIPGAIPPLMGWTTVTNSIDSVGIILFAILFVWQLPHFLSISVFYSEQYKNAGIKVYPNTQGIISTKRWIFVYTIALFLVSLLPYSYGFKDIKFMALVMALGFAFTLYALSGVNLNEDAMSNKKWAKSYFWGSLIYLPALMCGLIVFK